jgi:hypothetical protein
MAADVYRTGVRVDHQDRIVRKLKNEPGQDNKLTAKKESLDRSHQQTDPNPVNLAILGPAQQVDQRPEHRLGELIFSTVLSHHRLLKPVTKIRRTFQEINQVNPREVLKITLIVQGPVIIRQVHKE